MSQPYWAVVFTPRSRKDLGRLDPPVAKRITSAIRAMAEHQSLPGARRLANSDEYRLRVGDWRVRFLRDGSELVIIVIRILPRGRAYER